MLTYFDHFPYSELGNQSEIAGLNLIGTPGETVNASFDIESTRENSRIEIHSGELAGQLHTVPADAVDLSIVKIWAQAGVGVYQSQEMQVRELLLKDDSQDLRDGYRRRFKRLWHFRSPYRLYSPPNLRLHGHASTLLAKGARKQIWVSISIPPSVPPGAYTGELKMFCDGRSASGIKIDLDVLPLRLDRPRQDLFLWYRGKLDSRDSLHYVPERIFRAQLQSIFDHGFTSISISESDRKLAQKAVDIVEEIGFDRHLIFIPPFPCDFNQLRYRQVAPVAYVSDEIDMHIAHPQPNAIDHIKEHKATWTRAHQAGVKTMAALVQQPFTARFLDEQDIGCAPEMLNYFLAYNREYFAMHERLPDPRKLEKYYYWQAYMEKPNLHRLLAGVYLWKTGADGIAPYCYQHMPVYPNSPYDDSDEWDPQYHAGPVRRPFKDHMLTYPARRGSVRTLQWEGFREGITDLRYLVTLENALTRAAESDNCPRDLIAAIRKRLAEFLARIDLKAVVINSETRLEPYDSIEAWEYDDFRKKNASDIIALNAFVQDPDVRHEDVSHKAELTTQAH